MAKKDQLSGVFNNMLATDQKEKEPKKQTQQAVKEPVKEAAEPKAELKPMTYRLEQRIIDVIKDYAYTKRIKDREALTLMVDSFIAQYEADPANEPILKRK